jgi:hypothetical protein
MDVLRAMGDASGVASGGRVISILARGMSWSKQTFMDESRSSVIVFASEPTRIVDAAAQGASTGTMLKKSKIQLGRLRSLVGVANAEAEFA